VSTTARRQLLLGLAVALPLLVAGVVLLFRPWVPVLDMAMTEFRVRDVGGRHTPLVGLPGRIGDFPDQGSHPGPWSFYLIAPFYRLALSTAWGMELASIVINSACVVVLVVMGHRRVGAPGAVVLAGIGALAVRGYGLTVLTHPWNPYFPVLVWLVALVATWSVLAGDHWFAPLATATSVLAAQTHVPYLVSAIALNGLVVGALGLRWWHGRAAAEAEPETVRPLLATLGAALVLWTPPFVEQLRNGDDGNIAKLIDHFGTEQDEAAIGLAAAFRLLTQHFDVVRTGWDLLAREDAFVHRAGQVDAGTSVVGVLVLVAWAAAGLWAWQRRHRELLALHAVTVVMAVTGLVSISRIFGKVWFYLTLWMSGTVLLVVVALAWTAWSLVTERRSAPDRRVVPGVALGVGAAVTLASLMAAVGHDVPEDDLAEDVRRIVPAVTAALDADVGAATGRDGSYVVFWQESVVPGSQGYALMNELERRGYRVGVHPTWRVPETGHRVRRDGEYTAEVHLVSGAWIDDWRDRPDHVLVVEYDDRDATERARFDELEARVIARLTELGRPELVEEFQRNIFGTSLRPELPRDVVDDLAEMLLLGEPVAVFVAPPGSTF
jgi:hypothetical protein